MDETLLREKIGELLMETRRRTVPVPEAPVLEAPADSAMSREMAALEDGLDHLRLAIKYLVFDLEATRRENHLLREMLG